MPPRTRMTPAQVAATKELKDVQWERRTGIDLVTAEQEAERLQGVRLASRLPKMLQRFGRGGR